MKPRRDVRESFISFRVFTHNMVAKRVTDVFRGVGLIVFSQDLGDSGGLGCLRHGGPPFREA